MSYRKLGDIVRFISNKNAFGKATVLYGINIDKFFMPSVANTIGVDLNKYKVVSKFQFACNRMHVGRDERLPISMSTSNYDFIVSPAYDVFEVIDNNVLPEYLMIWFRRSEFDRQCWFYTDADVRGGLSLDALKSIEILIPSIEKQRQIVAQYQAVANKIKVNEQICEKLEATAQALYKHWFVDFEFPNENGEPYKSSGGKMVYNEELGKEVPEGWRIGALGDICEMIDGDRGLNYPGIYDFFDNEYCLFLNAGNVTKKGFDFSKTCFITKSKDQSLRKGKLKINDIVLTSRGTVGNLGFYTDIIPFKNVRINSGMLVIRPRLQASYLFSLLNSFDFSKAIENYISGSAVPQLPIKDLSVIQILLPTDFVMNDFSALILPLYREIDMIKFKDQKLYKLHSLLLSRLATLDNKDKNQIT